MLVVYSHQGARVVTKKFVYYLGPQLDRLSAAVFEGPCIRPNIRPIRSVEISMPEPRFHNIITGACPVPLYDTVLWDLGDVVVTPTLGSIIPHWFLVIPRTRVLNMASWLQWNRSASHRYLRQVARRVGRSADEIIWFEHGTAAVNGITGCGVDHAHMHLLIDPPFAFKDFKNAAKSTADLNWRDEIGNPYDFVSPDEVLLCRRSR